VKVDRELVDKISELARLSIDDDDIDRFISDFEKILTYVEKVKELDTHNIEPAVLPFNIPITLRDDKTQTSISEENALLNAKDKKNNCFKVPVVVTAGN